MITKHIILITAFALTIKLISCNRVEYDREFSRRLSMDIEKLQEDPPVIDGNLIYNPDILIGLYEKDKGLLHARWDSWENIDQILYSIRNVYRDGLNPEDYHLLAIEDLVDLLLTSEEVNIADSALLELLLTDAFLLLSAHLAGGKVDNRTFMPRWKVPGIREGVDTQRFVDSTLQNKQIIENLRGLVPGHPEYARLKHSLLKYRQIEEKGGWQSFRKVLPNLEKGMWHPDIHLLRERLAAEQGDIEPGSDDENLFDHSLREQVILFQQRNGLEANGIVDAATVRMLNVSVYQRLDMIEVNLERWRWLSYDPRESFIRVNIPEFKLYVMENDEIVISIRAIAGTRERQTPVYSSAVTSIELNPYWFIPPSILINDIIPAVRRNIFYLEDRHMRIFRDDWTEVDPMSVDWESDFEEGFPYIIRQDPGPYNEMGRVKFLFPNPYYIAIHDTPFRELFEKPDRTLSSGCIRIDRPVELAAWILKDDPVWTRSDIIKIIDQGENHSVDLEEPVPVEILYLTVWPDDNGTVHFREDIYKLDRQVLEALKEDPPLPGL